MKTWIRVLGLVLKIVSMLGHLALLFFALAALALYGNLETGLVAVIAIGFAVMNSRLLFPWPANHSAILKSLRYCRLSLFIGLGGGLGLAVAGALGVFPFANWWEVFVILALTSGVNLLSLQVSAARA